MKKLSQIQTNRAERIKRLKSPARNNGNPFAVFNDNKKQQKTPTTSIALPKSVVVKEVPAYQMKASTVELIEVKDDAANKKVIAKTANMGDITLWEGADYDKIGQWTDSDVHTRLIQILVK